MSEHVVNSAGDAVVWQEGNVAVVRSSRAFGIGFNVYRLGERDGSGNAPGVKINPATSWFTTLEAALSWIESAGDAP